MPSGRFELRASSRTGNAASTTCRTCWGLASPDSTATLLQCPQGLLRPYLVDRLKHLVGPFEAVAGVHGDHPVEQPLIVGELVRELRPRCADMQRDQSGHGFGIERPLARQHLVKNESRSVDI